MEWKPVEPQAGDNGVGIPGKKKISWIKAYIAFMAFLLLFCLVMARIFPDSDSADDSSQSAQTEQLQEVESAGDDSEQSSVPSDDSGSSNESDSQTNEAGVGSSTDSSTSDGDTSSESGGSAGDEGASTGQNSDSSDSEEEEEEDPADTKSEDKVLTKKNCKELASLLKVSDPNSSKVASFAKAHEGDTIKFDGYVADMQHVEGMKTRFNVLIYAAGSPSAGPNFQYHDVNFYEMNVKPDSVDILAADTKVRVTAKVVSYNDVTGLFELDPVETYVKK